MQTTENKTIRERNNRQTKRNKRKPKVTNYLNSKINHLKKLFSKAKEICYNYSNNFIDIEC